jgi:twitching motility protein PilT
MNQRVKNWLDKALQVGASDLHLVVGLPPSLRVDGEIDFLPQEPLGSEELEEAMFSLLSPQQREQLSVKRSLEFSYSSPELGRVRASYYYACHRLEGCFRLVPKEIPDFQELGLPRVVEELASKTSGLILITGATGQGKTTTMNALIDFINAERRARIITIEDPIEYVHKNKRSVVIQREVPTDATCFPSALTSALRQDPNVICVGELRTLDTIATALTAAETGHLVLGTLHTNSATGAIDRMIDAFPAHQQNQVRMQLAASLRGVVCQQLLPRMAQKGRVLACEILVANHGVRTLIRKGRSDQIRNLIMMGQGEGMMAMDQSLRSLYESGEVGYEQALQCSHSGDLLRAS